MNITIDVLLQTIHQVKEKIPAQGPLEYFIHHNTLHHYQDMHFFEAVQKAAFDYQANALMPEEFYWNAYAKREINKSDLFYEIEQYTKKNQLLIPKHVFYRLLIQKNTKNRLQKRHESESIRQQFVHKKAFFFHYALQEDAGINIDHYIAPCVLKFMAAYFDYGLSSWPLHEKQRGMWTVFCSLYKQQNPLNSRFLNLLAKQSALYAAMDPAHAIQAMLATLPVQEAYVSQYLFELAFRYKGWAGFIKSVSQHPEWIKIQEIKPAFIDFICILLVAEIAAIQSVSQHMPAVPVHVDIPQHSEEFIHRYYYELTKHPRLKADFIKALPLLNDQCRKEILHKAYERTFYLQFLNACSTQTVHTPVCEPQYQVICCLDDREESLRRYLECDAQCETFGFAGHFGLNITYTGYFDKRARALCPVLAKPEYHIKESATVINPSGLFLRRLWGEMLWQSATSSKTCIKSFFAAFIHSICSAIPSALDILSPRITANMKYRFKKKITDAVKTRLLYKKESDNAQGMDLAARVTLAYQLLTTLGLRHSFGNYVIILGHGSSSINNPLEAAYDCGACGGGRGAPNARLMALLLNESQVRQALQEKAIHIPEKTRFIGAYHDTCSDAIDYFDIPPAIAKDFKPVQDKLDAAARLNAKERCRRFTALQQGKLPEYYRRKAYERSIDLRQPRPEYGHSTNAICIIGPRSFSKRLFLDRRSFLVSYDPYHDEQGIILDKLLNTAGPVCAGINLEYFFSYIDNELYGCGTKLPHNVTALVGVMNGYLSDLQNGLSSQMIEIHQPIRLCFMIVCSLNLLNHALNKASEFSQLVKNQWVTLSVHNIDDHKIYLYEDGFFTLFTGDKHPPTYFHQDEDIFNHTEHITFGHIA